MPPPVTISGGRFVGLLGRGGTAEVSRWSPDNSTHDLACKYPLTANPNDVELFQKLAEREWQLIGGWRFPGIVRLVSRGQQNDYLMMELCEGPSLDSVGRISFTKAVTILSSISATLSAIHAKGVIHCDIKPHNIFLPRDWETVSAGSRLFYSRLSDFSLGRTIAESETARAGIGTIGYAAPETVRDGLTSVQSDLFSLGVLAWQLFVGRHPFIIDERDADPVTISSRVSEEHPASLSELIPDCEERLSDLVTSLLAKSPQDRPSSAWEVCQILESIGSTYPIRKSIRPRHLLANHDGANTAFGRLIAESCDKNWLKGISNNSIEVLVSILDENHRAGRLSFDGYAFCPNAPVTWPSRLRQQALRKFSTLCLSQKKQAIKTAVSLSGNCEGIEEHTSVTDNALALLLIHLVRPTTVRRISLRLASRAQSSGDHATASRLFVQVGKFSDAIASAHTAATSLKSDHRNEDALAVLRNVTCYAELCNKLFDARNLLMLSGDIFKQTGKAEDAMAIYTQIVSLYDGHPPDKLLAECYKDIGDLCKMKQTFQEGIDALTRALEIYRLLDDELEVSHTLNNLGNIYWVKLDLPKAAHHYRIALRIQRRLRVSTDVATTLNNLGSCYVMQGRFRRAITLYEESLKISRLSDNQGEIARTLNNLGYTYHVMGQPSQAVQMLKESLEINRRIGSQKEVLFNIENLTQVMIGAGQLTESLPLLDEGTALSNQIGDTPHQGTFLLNRGLVAKRLGDFGSAAHCFDEVEQISSSIDSATLNLSLLIARAGLRFALGDKEGSISFASSALSSAVAVNDQPSRLNALIMLARLTDDLRFVSDGLSLADELGLKREKRLLRAWRFDVLLNTGDEIDEHATQLLADIDTFGDDLERSAILCIAANWLLLTNSISEAESYSRQAHDSAVEHALLPEQAQSLHIGGQVACARGDFETGYHSFRQALSICKNMSESIRDDEDKAMYLNQGWIQKLFSEIRRLASVLGQKKGQVVA